MSSVLGPTPVSIDSIALADLPELAGCTITVSPAMGYAGAVDDLAAKRAEAGEHQLHLDVPSGRDLDLGIGVAVGGAGGQGYVPG